MGNVIFQDDAVIGLFGSQLAWSVKGNRLKIAGGAPSQVRVVEHDIPYYPNPFYRSFEDFLRRCGEEGVGATLANLTMGAGTVLYLYDHRPQRKPLWSELTDEQRKQIDREEEVNGRGEVEGYDEGGNFGYAYNITDPYLSEWGYAPFPLAGETVEDMNRRIADSYEAIKKVFGAGEIVTIEGPRIQGWTQ